MVEIIQNTEAASPSETSVSHLLNYKASVNRRLLIYLSARGRNHLHSRILRQQVPPKRLCRAFNFSERLRNLSSYIARFVITVAVPYRHRDVGEKYVVIDGLNKT